MEINPLIVKDINLMIDELYHGVSSENIFLPFRPDSCGNASSFRSSPSSPTDLTGIIDPITAATPELFTTNSQMSSDDGDDGDPEEDDDIDTDDDDEFDEDEDKDSEDGGSMGDSDDKDRFDEDDEDVDEDLAADGNGMEKKDDKVGGEGIDEKEEDADHDDRGEDEDLDDEDDDLEEEEYGMDWDDDDDDDDFDDDDDELKPLNTSNRRSITQSSPSSSQATNLGLASGAIPSQSEKGPEYVEFDIT
jgi:hypothetical protein